MAKDGLMEFALIGVGGYFVLKYAFGIDLLAGLFGTVAPSSAGSGQPVTQTGGAGTTTNQTVTSLQTTQANTLRLVSQAAQQAGTDPGSLQSVDVWNYYYSQVKGIPGPSPDTLSLPNYQTGEKYSINDWWNAMTAHGFSGFGVIGHGPYNTRYRPPTGKVAGIMPSLIETLPKMLGQ